MGDIHQCPKCELRFPNRTELDDHLRKEHPRPVDDDTKSLDH